jgi:hypothetical protein
MHPNLFSAVPRALCPLFIFCTPRLILGGTEGAVSSFHLLRSPVHFGRERGCQVHFSYSFSAVPRAPSLIFLFCAPGLISGGTEGANTIFMFCAPRLIFGCTVGGVHISCFALPDSFSAVPRDLGPIFMFCAPGLIFGNNEGATSTFHVLCSRTHFWLYRRRRVQFSCFALPNSFSAILRASDPFFIFCAPGLFLGGTEAACSSFHVVRSRT